MHRIGIVAGEASGDSLGADLISSLQEINTNILFYGVGGVKMTSLGFYSVFPISSLSIMGIKAVIKNYIRLYLLNRKLIKYFLNNKPDIFIGIDLPDFNLPIERALKKKGIKTIQYVSPKTWAWRQKRIFKMRQSIDNILCLFPFENIFYQSFDMPSHCVGHPLSRRISLEPNTYSARKTLGISMKSKVISLLPGSRKYEVKHIAPVFLDVAAALYKNHKECLFVIPLLNEEIASFIKSQIDTKKLKLNIKFVIGQSQQVIESSDIVLTKAGTSTFEAMLFKKPMVVCYKTDYITYHILRRLVKTKYISLPNLLLNKPLVPELIQRHATVDNIISEINQVSKSKTLVPEFYDLHKRLNIKNTQTAATIVLSMLNESKNLI